MEKPPPEMLAFQTLIQEHFVIKQKEFIEKHQIIGVVVCGFKLNAEGDIMQALGAYSAAKNGMPTILVMALQGVENALMAIKATQQSKLVLPDADSNKFN